MAYFPISRESESPDLGRYGSLTVCCRSRKTRNQPGCFRRLGAASTNPAHPKYQFYFKCMSHRPALCFLAQLGGRQVTRPVPDYALSV